MIVYFFFGVGFFFGCANFALKRIVIDYEEEFRYNVVNFVRDNFYVDDGLKLVSIVVEVKGGLYFYKFIFNLREVLEMIFEDERVKGLKNLDFYQSFLVMERVLGVQWCVEIDSFQFRIIF